MTKFWHSSVPNQMVVPCADRWCESDNHTFWLLSKHSVSPCSATLCECQTKQMPRC